MTPKTIRFFVNLFIKNKLTYLIGMVFIRYSRKKRIKNFNNSSQIEKVQIDNCMGKIKMIVDKNSYMGGSFYWSGFHHVSEIIFLDRFLQSDMNFIDIGANQGEFSLFAASKLINGHVYSFEPVTKQFTSLSQNINLNKFNNISTFNYGLSNEIGKLAIYTSKDLTIHHGVHEGLSTLYQTADRTELEEYVELKIFDEQFENIDRIDFVKIDIEGAELFALVGMRKSLQKFKPTILIELNEETFSAAGYSIKEITNFLLEFGYEPFVIYRGELLKNSGDFSKWGNYIFKTKN